MTIEFLDPTHEADAPAFVLAPRPLGLAGATIGIISNGKKGTAPFFDALEQELLGRYGVGQVARRIKANYSAPAQAAIMQEAAGWDGLIAGIGD